MKILIWLLLVAPVCTAQRTHVGVLPWDMVTLEMVSGAKSGCGELKLDFVRVPQDGTGNTRDDAFRVPDGKFLVITDIDWYYNGLPSTVQVLRLIAENLGDSSKRRKLVESVGVMESSGSGGKNEHMTGGAVLSSKAKLCVEITPGPLGSPMRLSNVLIRGYLVGE